jgi:hypothetical protein
MKALKICSIAVSALIGVALFSSCEESKRYEISGTDTLPPGEPLFLSSKPLPGGATVFFRVPEEEDLLLVEASYVNMEGNLTKCHSSVYTDSLDILGFATEGSHEITLVSIDRAGNRSTPVVRSVTSLEPPIVTVAKSVQVLSSFSAFMVKWEDEVRANFNVIVDLYYAKDGVPTQSTVTFDTNSTETQTIDNIQLADTEPLRAKVTLKDNWHNTVASTDTTIALMTDVGIAKTKWSIPAPGTIIGGVIQVDGNRSFGRMSYIIDGMTEKDAANNYMLTQTSNPWNVIIDMGEYRELSRVRTFQRYSYPDTSVQGAFYRGDNILNYNMYVFDEATQTWERTSNHQIVAPLVRSVEEYVLLGDAGDEAFLYPDVPQFSRPTRYFRIEALNGAALSEVTLYGKPLN